MSIGCSFRIYRTIFFYWKIHPLCYNILIKNSLVCFTGWNLTIQSTEWWLNGGWMTTEWLGERWISVAFQSPFSNHSVDWMAGTFQWPFSQLILKNKIAPDADRTRDVRIKGKARKPLRHGNRNYLWWIFSIHVAYV